MNSLYSLTLQKSEVLVYDGINKYPKQVGDASFDAYAGKPIILKRFIIGQDYTGIELPVGTREVQEIRVLNMRVNTDKIYSAIDSFDGRWIVSEEQLKEFAGIFSYVRQDIRYLNCAVLIDDNDQLLSADYNFFTLKSSDGLIKRVPIIRGTIKVEQIPKGEELNLERMLEIGNVTNISLPTEAVPLYPKELN